TGLILVLTPIWIVIDATYPIMVEQQKRTGKLDFFLAVRQVLKKFWGLFAFFLLVLIATTLISLPFAFIVSLGLIFDSLLLIAFGIVFVAAVPSIVL
ncbi:MAG: hypothetical protein QXD70_06055, partial [Candidatus Bathyarchaeia archaeon]